MAVSTSDSAGRSCRTSSPPSACLWTRAARFDEGVEACRRLWSEENVVWNGDFYKFGPVTLLPRPAQRPHPPTFVAIAGSPESAERAGRAGHNLQVIPAVSSRERVQELLTVYRKAWVDAGHPRGVAGRMAGWVMTHRRSNQRRSSWAVSLLEVRPTDRVLEIGFGLAIAELAHRTTQGHVYGIDHSEVMVHQASRRNHAAIRAHRVELVHASVDQLPRFDEPLDAILAINSVGFWADPAQRLHDLRRLLRPAGRIALATQPRGAGATPDTTARAAHELRHLLTQAGFTQIRVETLQLDPPVACVLATNSADRPY